MSQQSRRASVWTAILLGSSLWACRPEVPDVPAARRAGGSMAVHPVDQTLWVADRDNNQVVRIDAESGKVVGSIATGRWPERIVFAADGRAYVSNRLDRSVSVIDAAQNRELKRLIVGAEPVGLALSADGKQLWVANQLDANVQVIDLQSEQTLRRVPVPAGPTGLARLDDGRMALTHQRDAGVSLLSTDEAKAPRTLSLGLNVDQTLGETRSAGQPADPVVSPDGDVYVAHVQAKADAVATEIPGAYTSGIVPVVATAVLQVDPATEQVSPPPAAEPSSNMDCGVGAKCATDAAVAPTMMMLSPAFVTASESVAGPSAAVADPGGEWLYVANELSNNVTILSTRGKAVPSTVRVGAGPSGIAVSATADRLWVHNAFDHSISVIEARGAQLLEVQRISIGSSPLTPQQELGRRLFFSSTDTRMTQGGAGGIACASCHPGGREDGRTWQFSEGPRNTPTLAGRHLARTAPYHWDGVLTTMQSFHSVVQERMGGAVPGNGVPALADGDFDAMQAYLDSLPAPDTAVPTAERTADKDAQVARGQALFEGRAGCASCHSGPDRTDDRFYDVGTIGAQEKFPLGGINTPPLHNLKATAPYLHDGSIATLRDRVLVNPGDRHGLTSGLSASEVDDLVAFLETL